MTRQRILIFIFLIVLAQFFLVSESLAVTGGTATGAGTTGAAAPGSTGLVNPLGGNNGITDPRTIIGNVIKAGLGIVGSLALVIFIFGGFTWVTSAGNEEKIKKGKDMLMWAVFGLAVVFLSYALVTFVINAMTGA